MIITICGSTKFKDDYVRTNADLTMGGHVVFSCGLFGHAEGLELTEKQKNMLDGIHIRKISMSDTIVVINKDEYIGESTAREISFAQVAGKHVIYKYEHHGGSEFTTDEYINTKGNYPTAKKQ